MALIGAQNISEEGIIPTLTGVSLSDTFENGGSTFVMINNGSESTITVTCVTQVTDIEIAQYGEVLKSDAELEITAGSIGFFGPFPVAAFNDDDGIAELEFSAIDSVTLAILTVGN